MPKLIAIGLSREDFERAKADTRITNAVSVSAQAQAQASMRSDDAELIYNRVKMPASFCFVWVFVVIILVE